MYTVHLALSLWIGGCRRGAGAPDVTDSTFVAAVAQLRRITFDSTLDSAGKAAARRGVFAKYKATPAELERTARAMARDPDRAVAIWRAIDARLQDTVAAAAPR